MELDHVGMLDSPTSWLELSRANLLHNLAGVRALVGDTKLMAILKANAYGSGAVGMAQALVGAGVDAFGVATVAEGVELRRAGIGDTIICLAYFTRDEVDPILEHDLTATIFSAEAGQLLASRATAEGRRAPVWVKVDTGLGRLGVPFREAADFCRALGAMSGLEIAGLFSTLTENPVRDPIQLQRLLDVRRALPELAGVVLSLASSNGIVSLPASYLDMVRPGILLHGLEPSERDRMNPRLVARADLRPITTWKARVVYAKTLGPGEQAGYGSRPALDRTMQVATLALGWADGYPAAMAHGGAVLLAGRRCPVLAVSANSTIVDITDAQEVLTNDEVALLGRQGSQEITAWEMARITHDSVYRLLTAIPLHVPRLWS
jgi:alanine racemase